MKTKHMKVPEEVYAKIERMGTTFNIPKTKAFILREKIIMGDFNLKPKKIRRKGRSKKEVFEIEL